MLLLLLLLPGLAWTQTNFYVSPTGNNNNAGSLASPWRTVQYGLDLLSTNDTLNLLTGTYAEKVVISVSGITLRNHAGHSPVLDGQGLTAQNSIIEIRDLSGITVQGLELKNSIMPDAQGILIQGDCHDITVKACTIHDIHFSSNPAALVDSTTNAQGIIVYGTVPFTAATNIRILNNHLYNCRLGYSEGIAVNGNVDGFEVSGNLVHDLTNIGIDCIGHEGTCPEPLNDQARSGIVRGNIVHHCVSNYATSAGIYIDGARNIIIENNTTYLNGYGIEVGCENVGKTTDGILVRSNVMYDNEFSGVAWGGFDYPGGSGKVTNSSFTNNSCLRNGTGAQTFGEVYLSYSENSVFQNNIFSAFGSNILVHAELGQPGLFFDYNIAYGPSGAGTLYGIWNGTSFNSYASFQSVSQTSANSPFVDPMFVGTQAGSVDLHLQPGSPAIGAGNPNYLPQPSEVDMDAEPRAFGIVDCGADEFYSGNGLPRPLSAAGILMYPNPTADLLYLDRLPAPARVTLHDATGVCVYDGHAPAGKGISLREYPAGTYLLTVTARNGQQSWGKVVKQ